jgi:hypothetical protein
METEDGIDRADLTMYGFMGEMTRAQSLDALVDIETRALAWYETDRIERDGCGGLCARLRRSKIKAALDLALNRLCK